MSKQKRVLFLCTGNSARSQIAEGLLRHMAGDRFEVASAGVAPTQVRPEAIEVMRELGIDITDQRSKSVDEFVGGDFDYVITVCDNAKEQCPVFPGQTQRIHWSFDDPAIAEGDELARLEVFRRVRDEISERLHGFVAERKLVSSSNPVPQVLAEWRETAKYWTMHSATIRTMFAPLTTALIERAGIREGQSVLDVAGGAGEPSLTIAATVGPAGMVTCTDAVPEMVAAARSEANRRVIQNVQFRVCTADSLPFPEDSFDTTVSRLGVMFFPDPVAAIREMLRVTRPEGRVAFAVWHKSELNPFCYVVGDVIARHVESPPTDPDAPNAFRFAEPGKLANLMRQAGVVDVAEHIITFNIEAPISALQFWAMRSETSDTLRQKLRKLSADEQAQVAGEVERAVKQFFPGNQMSFPTQMILVTGKKRG
jgi:arsenate reductase